jgi:hypothetical protein
MYARLPTITALVFSTLALSCHGNGSGDPPRLTSIAERRAFAGG